LFLPLALLLLNGASQAKPHVSNQPTPKFFYNKLNRSNSVVLFDQTSVTLSPRELTFMFCLFSFALSKRPS
jgi:hypothetical protein